MMDCIDDNNLLKRVEHREMATEVDGPKLGDLKGRGDPRTVGDDYFLSMEEVNSWSLSKWDIGKGGKPRPDEDDEDDEEGSSPCEEKWKNMNDAHTTKAWGVFDVQGWFILLCQHSFLLKAADMHCCGEHFLAACKAEREVQGIPLNDDDGFLAIGYDLGCKTVKTIAQSPLQALVLHEKLQMLTGILHGHAHQRLCQLVYLLIYVLGAGNEHLEQAERYFSKSNLDNLETFANVSKLIYANYREALRTIATKPSVIRRMKERNITNVNTFSGWLAKEADYLRTAAKIPEEDTARMDYVKALKHLASCQERLAEARRVWKHHVGTAFATTQCKEERVAREEIEKEMKLMVDVQHYEEVLNIPASARWKKCSVEWKDTEKLINERELREAGGKLEGLIVARIFELQKMNVAGTGYKMGQHLSHTLKARSKAIKNALEHYNKATSALSRRQLKWKDIINCTFLSKFNILQESHGDIHGKPWAVPANRELSTAFFKLAHAEETLPRLHNEIKSLVTWMKEEDEYLRGMERYYKVQYPQLAYQIRLHRLQRARFFNLHCLRLRGITRLQGFNPRDLSFFQPGLGIKQQTCPDGVESQEREEETEEENDGKSEGENEDQEVHEAAETVMGVYSV
ncbi:hypothetical protein AAF712_016494 [Marasmius tenuissimus]|uniref:Uncharacterized protein n=1 Tax=Marasmius tenuissimus TaxID=585030 RepID=A0ABR2Z6D7_9AGAR